MCTVPIWAWNDIEGYPRKIDWAKSYIVQGTKAGHYACQLHMAELYRKGVAVPPELGEEKRLMLLAAEAGYTHAFIVLGSFLTETNKILVHNLDRYMCWKVASTLYKPFAGIRFSYYEAAAKGAYPQLGLSEEERVEVARLTKKWQEKMRSAKVIMDIVNECLIMERGIK